jgi:hypothetical protein
MVQIIKTVIIFWLIYVSIAGVWMAIELALWGRTFPSFTDSVIAAVMAFILTSVVMQYLK